MGNSAKMCIFFYPRAKKVNKCVNENQYYGNVVLLWLVLLCTGTLLITYVLFILQVLMHPVFHVLIGTCVCGGRSSVHVSDRSADEQDRLHKQYTLHDELDWLQEGQNWLHSEHVGLKEEQEQLQDEQDRLEVEQDRLQEK